MFLSSQKKFHFMGGLPRSGSTFLSSLLNQNPRFDSSSSSPVLLMMHTIIASLTKSLQEVLEKIEILETKVAALEAQ